MIQIEPDKIHAFAKELEAVVTEMMWYFSVARFHARPEHWSRPADEPDVTEMFRRLFPASNIDGLYRGLNGKWYIHHYHPTNKWEEVTMPALVSQFGAEKLALSIFSELSRIEGPVRIDELGALHALENRLRAVLIEAQRADALAKKAAEAELANLPTA